MLTGWPARALPWTYLSRRRLVHCGGRGPVRNPLPVVPRMVRWQTDAIQIHGRTHPTRKEHLRRTSVAFKLVPPVSIVRPHLGTNPSLFQGASPPARLDVRIGQPRAVSDPCRCRRMVTRDDVARGEFRVAPLTPRTRTTRVRRDPGACPFDRASSSRFGSFSPEPRPSHG